MRQLLLVLALAIAVAAVGHTRFRATGVVVRNRPFVTGNLVATEFWYDKPGNRTAWTWTVSPTYPNNALREAYIYTKNLRLRKCKDECEALGEDLAVPDLVSSGNTNGNSQPGCPNCYSKTPSPQNGQVAEVCYSGQAACYVRFSTGEEWEIEGAQSRNNFPADTFLDQSVEANLGGACGESCNQRFDIVLVLDESGSIDGTEWNQLKSFAVELVNAFEVGPNDANFAIKLYSTTARDRLELSPSLNSIISQLNGIDKRDGWTCMGCGLKLANDELDANKRPGVPGLIITLTDGFNNRPCDFSECCKNSNPCGSDCCRSVPPYSSNHNTPRTGCSTCGSRPLLQEQHDRADAAGYKMISIGVGNSLNDADLELISTNWPEDHIAVANFAELQSKLAEILRVVCPKSPVNECGDICNGYCHCGQSCGCPVCENKDMCHTAECVVNAGYACIQTEISCDDGNFCTEDSCDPLTGCVHTPISCDSGKDCKIDSCDPATGCQSKNRKCTSNDGCIEVECVERNGAAGGGCQSTTVTDAMCEQRAMGTAFEGLCHRHFCDDGCKSERIDCDGGNACFDYGCDPATGCTSVDISANCEKNNMCKTYGCDPVNGCFDEDVTCDDGLVCTTDDCEPDTGCTFTLNGDCGPCKHLDDTDVDCAAHLASQINNDACLVPYCDLSGPTAADNTNAPLMNCKIRDRHVICDTGNMCFDESCNSDNGQCVRTPVNCDDNNMCTTDSCDAATGCVHEVITCSPRSACETADCDPAQGCVYTPINCTAVGNDLCRIFTCDDQNGCQSEPKCTAPNDCHSVMCEPATGNCVETYLCDDNDACTDDSCDFSTNIAGVCVNVPFNATEKCNDNSVCTEDVCEPAVGCVNRYMECPNVNETLPCRTAQECDPQRGCTVTKVLCPATDNCFSESCEFKNATATTDAVNSCEKTPIDNFIHCDLGVGATAGIALGAGVIFAIICAVVVVGILGSIGAWKAYDALMASNIDSGLASPNPLHDPGVTEGVNPLS